MRLLLLTLLLAAPAPAQRADTDLDRTFVRGLTRAYLGDHEAATALFARVLEKRPDDLGALVALAESYGALDRAADALFYAERAAAEAPGEAAAWRLVAEWRQHAGNTQGAREAMRRLDALGQADADDLATLAQLHALTGDDRAAVDAYGRLFDRTTGRPAEWARMLAAARRLGDVDAALRALRHLEALDPQNPAFGREAVTVLVEAGRAEEADAERARLRERFPEPAPGIPEAGAGPDEPDTLGTPGSPAEAERAALLARQEQAPLGTGDAARLGLLHLRQGYAGDAIPLLRRVTAADPADLAAWEALGEALLQPPADDPGAALAAADDAALLFPGHPVPLLARAHALARRGETAAAQGAFAQALAGTGLLGDGPDALRWRGQALAGLERWDEAAAALERALASFPADPALLERLGDVEAARGNASAARAHWNAARELAPNRPSLRTRLAP